MTHRAIALLAVLLTPVPLLAQAAPGSAASASSLVAAGDSAYAARRPNDALHDYLAAAAADSTQAEALWRASRTEVELAEFEPDTARADSLLRRAETHGRAAVALAPHDAAAHFALAQALGRIALRTPILGRLPVAREVHSEALACLAIAPHHEGCLHALGLWDAEYLRLGYASRQTADLMGGELFKGVTWDEAESTLRAAIAVDSQRAIHHLDLAKIYLDQGKTDSARAEFEAVLRAPVRDLNDAHYQAIAKAALDSGREGR